MLSSFARLRVVPLVALLASGPLCAAGRGDAPLQAAGPSRDGGWIECVRGSVPEGQWVSELRATFVVPSAPRRDGQLLYVFPALESRDWRAILQSVLRFWEGRWSITSYRLVDGEVTHSDPVPVEPGDTIRSTMRSSWCTARGACTWTITTTDATTGESTRLTEQDPLIYPRYEAGALEAYHVTACDQYPADGVVRFDDVAVFDQDGHALPVAPQRWVSEDASPRCGFEVATKADGASVLLFFVR